MFKDMLTQKKNMLLSKLTSFDSDVSAPFACLHACLINQGYSYGRDGMNMLDVCVVCDRLKALVTVLEVLYHHPVAL